MRNDRKGERRKGKGERQGVTLLELTVAVAIFSVAIGAAAQILISFYATMDVQSQRVIAINYCRGLLSDMRSLRDAKPNAGDPDPCLRLETLQERVFCRYPQSALELDLEGERDRPLEKLRDAQVEIDYEDTSAAANPVAPTVRVRWNDLRGHPAMLAL